jgi:hypothetical protein
VPALSREHFGKAYLEIANKLPIRKDSSEDLKESVRRYLSSEAAGRWLLVVDNADDVDILFGTSEQDGINQYFPESEYGLTLFTTRSRNIAVSTAGNDLVALQEMDVADAENLLVKYLRKEAGPGADHENPESIFPRLSRGRQQLSSESASLLNELTYLPLAITQAANYINATGAPITEYLKLLKGADQNTVSLMSREFVDGSRYKGSQNAVATTWLVSFDQIRKCDSAAADLLSFMSCIEPKGIPQ